MKRDWINWIDMCCLKVFESHCLFFCLLVRRFSRNIDWWCGRWWKWWNIRGLEVMGWTGVAWPWKGKGKIPAYVCCTRTFQVLWLRSVINHFSKLSYFWIHFATQQVENQFHNSVVQSKSVFDYLRPTHGQFRYYVCYRSRNV